MPRTVCHWDPPELQHHGIFTDAVSLKKSVSSSIRSLINVTIFVSVANYEESPVLTLKDKIIRYLFSFA